MLEISVVPKHGAGGHGRFYPHSGYFGLSPVVISGTLIARLPALCQPLPVRQVLVTVRCTEKRTLAGHTETQAVVWEKTKRIWEPAGEEEYGSLGDWEGAFKLVVPPDVARIAPSMQCTRDTKVTWHLEATIEHKPIPYVGTRLVATHLLHLRSYLAPSPHSSTPLTPPAPFTVPGAQVYVHAPVGVYGPGDTFNVSFHVRPDDPDVVVRKGSALLERRSEALGVPRPSPGLLEPREHQQRESRGFFRRSRSRSRSSSPGASAGAYQRLGDEDEGAGGTMVRSTVLEAAAGDPVPGSGGGWWFTASGLVPVRSHKWDAGETGRTPLATTSFGVRVRFVLKSKGAHGREVTCSAVPIVLVAASAAERADAQTALAAAAAAADDKARGGVPGTHLPKKRHRSSRRGLYMHEGTVEISDPILIAEREREREEEREARRRKSPEASSPSPELDMSDQGEAVPSSTPILVVPGVKPILLRDPSEGVTQTQSISFATPAHPARSRSRTRSARADSAASASTSTTDSDAGMAPPLQALSPSRRPASMVASTSTSMSISQLIHPDASPFSPTIPQSEREREQGTAYASWRDYGLGSGASVGIGERSIDASLQRQFQHSGRRISATTSEEDEVQPSRSRPRLGDKAARGHAHHEHNHSLGHVRAHSSIPFIRRSSSSSSGSGSGSGVFGLAPGPGSRLQAAEGDRPRPSLPSLNVLGLGLPHVPEYDRTPRPRTAPSHSVYPSSGGASRPSSSGAGAGPGAGGAGIGSMGPPPLAAALSRPATASSVWERPVEGVFAVTGAAPRAPPVPPASGAARPMEPRGTTTVVLPVRDEEEGYRVGAGAFRRGSAGNVLGKGQGLGPRGASGAGGTQQGQGAGDEARFAFGLRG